MKRLTINIEDIYIKGGPVQLTEVITSIDNSLQKLSQATEDATILVNKYSSSNKGQQYRKMASALEALSNRLYEASVDINSMQNEIVNYQNKVMRYEGMAESAVLPNKITIERAHVEVDIADVKFELNEMNEIKNGLNIYSATIFYGMQDIVRKKNDIGQIWLDTQYKTFAEFIDELNMDTLASVKTFGEYLEYLEERIKAISN